MFPFSEVFHLAMIFVAFWFVALCGTVAFGPSDDLPFFNFLFSGRLVSL
jgi:hypothetical protein